MKRITSDRRLEKVERILASGSRSNLLDFELADEDEYYVWDGHDDANWEVSGVDRARYGELEDRIELLPEGDYFVCEINATQEEGNEGAVSCWSV